MKVTPRTCVKGNIYLHIKFSKNPHWPRRPLLLEQNIYGLLSLFIICFQRKAIRKVCRKYYFSRVLMILFIGTVQSTKELNICLCNYSSTKIKRKLVKGIIPYPLKKTTPFCKKKIYEQIRKSLKAQTCQNSLFHSPVIESESEKEQ